MGIKSCKLFHVTGKAPSKSGDNTRHKEEKARGQWTFGPCFKAESYNLTSNLGGREPGGTNVEARAGIPRQGPVPVFPPCDWGGDTILGEPGKVVIDQAGVIRERFENGGSKELRVR